MSEIENSSAADDTADPAGAATRAEPHMIPKSRLDEEIGKRRAVEAELASLADALKAEIPAHLQRLVPTQLPAPDLVRWLMEARATGLAAGTVKVPETDTRKPGTTPKSEDMSQLPAVARMARGYGMK
jgi:hypothetical protein